MHDLSMLSNKELEDHVTILRQLITLENSRLSGTGGFARGPLVDLLNKDQDSLSNALQELRCIYTHLIKIYNQNYNSDRCCEVS